MIVKRQASARGIVCACGKPAMKNSARCRACHIPYFEAKERSRKRCTTGHLIQNLKVYLCGPINGCNDSECKDWREFVKLIVRRSIDPMDRDYRGRELEPGIAREIVENDKADIDGCDVVLVNYVKPSVGTAMEILYGWEHGKRIIIVCEAETVLSPWLLYHNHGIFHSLTDALKSLA